MMCCVIVVAMKILLHENERRIMAKDEIVLGGGCFWCLEAVFQETRGVLVVESGHSGGRTNNPTYDDVCSGRTGHAEVIRIEFDTGLIQLRDLLEIFFTMHDPTTLNRQGNDVGTQYRSVLYFHNQAQEVIAHQVIAEMANVWDAPIVTELAALSVFYKAEDYHQNYFRQHAEKGYCAMVVAPKVAKFRKIFVDKCKV